MARLDVERKYVRSDGRVKILLRTPSDRRATITLLRDASNAAEFTEGEQVEENGQGGYRKPMVPGMPDARGH